MLSCAVICLQIGDVLMDENEEEVRQLPHDPFFDGKDPQHVAQLCAETIDEGHSVLIFCASKKVGVSFDSRSCRRTRAAFKIDFSCCCCDLLHIMSS